MASPDAPPDASRQATTGRTLTLDVFLFDGAGVVTGTVFRADGITPVPNAEVTVGNERGALGFAVTDASGTYRVETVPLGPVFVDSFEAASSRTGFAQGSIDLAGRVIDLPVTQSGSAWCGAPCSRAARWRPWPGRARISPRACRAGGRSSS